MTTGNDPTAEVASGSPDRTAGPIVRPMATTAGARKLSRGRLNTNNCPAPDNGPRWTAQAPPTYVTSWRGGGYRTSPATPYRAPGTNSRAMYAGPENGDLKGK